MKHINGCLLFFVTLFVSVQSHSYEDNSNGVVLLNQTIISNDIVLFEQAILMSAEGDWFNAEKIFRDVALRNPQWPEPKNNLAIALFKLGNLEQARKALDEAVISLPNFKVAQENRQRCYDYTSTLAYYKVVNLPEPPEPPKLELLTEILLMPNIANLKQSSTGNNSSQLDDIEQQVRESVNEWSRVWSASDVDAYIAAYSTRFKPYASKDNYEQWRTARTNKLKFGKKASVRLEPVEIYLNNDRRQALVQFVQHYQSSSYQDVVTKQLQLVLDNNHWLIISERVLDKLN